MAQESIRNLAINASRSAGAILLEHFGTEYSHKYKDNESANTVTDADLAANDCILGLIRREFPQHTIISEESPEHKGSSEYSWIIDPLDGTNNFLHGLPQFAVSIAVLKNGEPIFAVVYQPVGDILFTAERGAGAMRNGKRIHCSKTSSLSEALVGLGFYYDRGALMRATLRSIERFFASNVHGVRRLGCASLDLCYVASGIFDVFFEYTLSPWDYAAAMLIVEEAGGRITDVHGADLKMERCSVLASNESLYEVAQAIVVEELSAADSSSTVDEVDK